MASRQGVVHSISDTGLLQSSTPPFEGVFVDIVQQQKSRVLIKLPVYIFNPEACHEFPCLRCSTP
jgi:hypothetical protein